MMIWTKIELNCCKQMDYSCPKMILPMLSGNLVYLWQKYMVNGHPAEIYN